MSYHISDQQFQDYFDGQLSETEAEKIISHKTICDSCAESYDHYKQLFSIMSEIPQPNFSPAFTKNIIHQIMGEKTIFSEKVRLIIFSILSLTGSLAIALYFMDYSRIILGFKNLEISFDWINKTLAYFSSVPVNLQGYLLFFTGIAVILLIGIIDHLAIKKKHFRPFTLTLKLY